MDNPWGISGPGFLWLYVGGLAVASVATVLLRRRAKSAGATDTREPLTIDEIAYLAGGRGRVVEWAFANLVDKGAVRVERSGQLHAVRGSAYRPVSAVEVRALEHVAARPGRKMDYYWPRVTRLPVFDELESALKRRGLMAFGVGRGAVFLAATPLVVLLVIGVVRAVNGARLGYPIGFLVALLVLTCVVIGFAMRGIGNGPTPAGRRVLRHGGHVGGAAALVARNGMAAYPDPLVSHLLTTPAWRLPSRRIAGGGAAGGSVTYVSGSSAGCGSSGSSCGGGCGGGGGGCGGGGGGV